MRYINGTRLDDRVVRTDWCHCMQIHLSSAPRRDAGFEDGRQYGRGKSGGQACGADGVHRSAAQVRDEYRSNYDADRGGYGAIVQTGGGAAGAGVGLRHSFLAAVQRSNRDD